MGRWVMGQMGHVNRWVTWVMGLGYDGSDGSWVTNGDPWSTLLSSITETISTETQLTLMCFHTLTYKYYCAVFLQ